MSFCKQILEEINSVRTNPSGYVDKILKYKDYFEGNILNIPGEEARIQTYEGASAYEEAANFLKTANSTEAFIPSKGLSNIANDYLEQLLYVGMDKSDNIDMNEIIDKYGNFTGEFNQLMEFGSQTPEQIVISLLVCDGDTNRTFRGNLLNPDLKKVGIASKKNDTNTKSTIIVASTNFKNKDDTDDNETFEENNVTATATATTTNTNEQVPLMTLSQMINPNNEEEERLKKEEEERLKQEEEERLKKEEEERLKREEEERLKKEEEERLKREEEERLKKEEEER